MMLCVDKLEGGEENLVKLILKDEGKGRREDFPAKGQPVQKS